MPSTYSGVARTKTLAVSNSGSSVCMSSSWKHRPGVRNQQLYSPWHGRTVMALVSKTFTSAPAAFMPSRKGPRISEVLPCPHADCH